MRLCTGLALTGLAALAGLAATAGLTARRAGEQR